MSAATALPAFRAPRRVDLAGPDFTAHKYDYYRWMLEERPVGPGRIGLIGIHLVARYEDCRFVLTDPRFVRSRGRARGNPDAGPLPFPLPRSVAAIATSMIVQDDPAHRRLRGLVNQAFTHRAVERLSGRVASLCDELLDGLASPDPVDLIEAYARPVPTRVIAEMVGLPGEDVEQFRRTIRALTKGLSGFSILRSFLWDLRSATKFVRRLIAHKRSEPGEDILSALILAEEAGDRLDEDELIAMVFLLVLAGFETTMHLIANGVRTLLEHPDQLERLRAEPRLWATAVDEIVRHRGPIHGTKPQYPVEDVTLHGYTMKRGTPVIPLLGAANHDPRAFENADAFDVGRSPNHHLGFGLGAHYCLGRQLALMETRIALQSLFERYPDVRLAVPTEALELARMPAWHRHVRLPVRLG